MRARGSTGLGVGLKAGMGNEEMRNKEMEKWGDGTLVRAEPWVIYWQKIDSQSRRPDFHGFGIQLINGWHL